jgi:hypothetical protein
MRRVPVAAALLVATVLAGCGGEDKPAPAPAPVRLSLDSPRDTATVQADSVVLRGSVSPVSARVRVRGEQATMSSGRFRAEVPLDVGTNVIDVVAEAPGKSPAFAAIRVTREDTVAVPDVAGLSVDDARSALKDAGLKASVRRKGGFLEDVVPRSVRVCDTDPPAGESVPRGRTVEVTAGRLC